MPRIRAATTWALNYRLVMSVIRSVRSDLDALKLDAKSLFLLAEADEHPYPAELAALLSMPKPTVTVLVKGLEAAGFLKRAIDAADLRRHRLVLTSAGRKAMTRGLAILSNAFAKRLTQLSASEQHTLHALLEKIS